MTSPQLRPRRIAVAGAGFIGRQHIARIRVSARADLVSVSDPGAGPFPDLDCPMYPDLPGMLASARPEAVVIATPNAFHVDMASACIEAGAAVLLEKPVADDHAAALRLADEVRRRSARVLVGHQRRHHPAVARARAALRDGEIGELVAVSGIWSARKDNAYFADVPWHREPGAGVGLINLVHDLDLLRHLCGEVSEVQAMTSGRARGLPVEDTVSLSIRFEGGALGNMMASDAGASPWGWDHATEEIPAFPFVPDGVAYRFVGTAGALSVPNLAKYTYGPATSPDWHSPLSRTYLPTEPRNSFDAQLDHFVDVARGQAEPLVSVADAARTLAVIDAVMRSADTGATARPAVAGGGCPTAGDD